MNNLQAPPGSPLILQFAAEAVLILHIGGGMLGLASGAAALALPKGKRLHRLAGDVFVVSMLVMAGIGTVVSPFEPQPQRANVVPGMLTAYLVATAWLTVRPRRPRAEIAGLAFAWATAAIGVMFAWQAAHAPGGRLDTEEPFTYLVYAAFPAMAGAFDLTVLLRGGVAGAHRLARHIWRTCFALFIATVSLFLGQPKVFPPALRGAPIMFVPELAVLGVMLFWLLHTALTGWRRPALRQPLGSSLEPSA